MKNRALSIATGLALALSVFGAAGSAQAASLTSTQIQAVVNLLQAFGADSSTVANVQSVLENQPVASTGTTTEAGGAMTPSVLPNGCTVISAGLHRGSTDGETEGEVSKLQQFLSKDPSIYPQGLVTGFFGSDTEEALQRWQAAHNIVATGTPDTTGFGVLGPQTRGEIDHEMETECEQGDNSSSHGGEDSSHASSTKSSEGGDN